MIPDLLLAAASIAVLLSPVVMEAGSHFELHKKREAEKSEWEQELPS